MIIARRLYLPALNVLSWNRGEYLPDAGKMSFNLGVSSLIIIFSLINSDGDWCGRSYCSQCEPEWIKCQYCDDKFCSIECGDECIFVCGGKNCNRANCQEGSCMKDNSKKAECVKTCADWGGLEHEWGCWDTYCTDCRVKACQKKDWKKCCPVCVRKVAPVLAAEVKKLRKENEKLREGGGK